MDIGGSPLVLVSGDGSGRGRGCRCGELREMRGGGVEGLGWEGQDVWRGLPWVGRWDDAVGEGRVSRTLSRSYGGGGVGGAWGTATPKAQLNLALSIYWRRRLVPALRRAGAGSPAGL